MIINKHFIFYFLFYILVVCPFQGYATSTIQKKNYLNAQFDYFKYKGKDNWFDQPIDRSYQYYNPILAGFYPDPSICRKGDTYYLVNSSFSYFPGVPLFKSKDLVNWIQVGHVLDRPSQLMLNGVQMSGGIYAPAIEYNPHNDTFYMITTNTSGIGNFFVKTKDPEKGWSDPILLPEVSGIDPSFLFDDDGKAYIVHNDAPEKKPDWNQQRAIRIHEFDVKNDCTIGVNKEIVRGGVHSEEKPIWIEGPHLYKINGYYYLMCAEGGTGDWHSEVIFRSKSPFGPFEPAQNNPILTQRNLQNDRKNNVSNTGHADMIQSVDGSWWAVFLGVRPYEKNHFNTGRETFMLPVKWENGFPVILPKGEAVPLVVEKKGLSPEKSVLSGNTEYVQKFDNPKLDFSWIFIRTPQTDFFKIAKGKLIITALPVSIEERKSPAAIMRRQQHTNFEAETQLEFNPVTENDFAGFSLFQNERFQILYGKTIIDGKSVLAVYRIEKSKLLIKTIELTAKQSRSLVKLKIEVKGRIADFLYSFDGKDWLNAARDIDAANLSTEHAGGFVGTTIGLYATAKHLNY